MWCRKQQYPYQPGCLAPKRRREAISLPSPQYLYIPLSGSPHSLLKEFYSSTPSRYPAGHAQEPSRPNAPGRNFLSRSPEVTGRDLPPPGPRTQKPRGKRAGSTNGPGTEPRRAGSTGCATLRNRDRGPSCLASARNAASRRFPAKRDASAAPRPTGSPAGDATPSGDTRENRRGYRRNDIKADDVP